MIAFLSDGVPPAAVYLVRPFCMAAMAASLMCWGVSKSGSPAPMAITSRPSAFSFAALADTARVGEGLMTDRRFETNDMDGSGIGWEIGQPFYFNALVQCSIGRDARLFKPVHRKHARRG